MIKRQEDEVVEVRKLPPIKTVRIDNVSSMIGEIRLMLRYCMPEELKILNFNVNGSILDMGLFIDRLCDKVSWVT